MIPIKAAEEIAKKHNYDQIIIIGRRIDSHEHVTTYGKNKTHCAIAARIGEFIKFKIMKWQEQGSDAK